MVNFQSFTPFVFKCASECSWAGDDHCTVNLMKGRLETASSPHLICSPSIILLTKKSKHLIIGVLTITFSGNLMPPEFSSSLDQSNQTRITSDV
uniref:Uncharacterized protein n=1 Tax=Romanomermis culicivorax TaxID=13658 RepID=A0A915KX75_ROMCU